MKVGILTFIEADNYGAVLQAFALQKYINSLGHDCKIIRYRNRNIWIQFHNRTIKESSSIKQYIKSHVRIALNRKRTLNFEKFRESLPLTRIYDSNSIHSISNEFDKIIVGSDQVWNPLNTSSDRVFLLDFLSNNDKKIAYAASFGNTHFFNDFGDDAIESIKKIPHISVREKEGEHFLASHNINSKTVADPVLLLSKKQWSDVCAKNNPKNEEYIFVYQLRPLKEIVEFVQLLAKKTGLKVYILAFLPSSQMLYNSKLNKENVYNIGPVDFLNYILNAKYVITDSFHGMALSVCMHKQFFIYTDTSKGNTSGRIHSLLEMCNITSRIISENKIDLSEIIDYNEVEANLQKMREESFEFLNSALE